MCDEVFYVLVNIFYYGECGLGKSGVFMFWILVLVQEWVVFYFFLLVIWYLYRCVWGGEGEVDQKWFILMLCNEIYSLVCQIVGQVVVVLNDLFVMFQYRVEVVVLVFGVKVVEFVEVLVVGVIGWLYVVVLFVESIGGIVGRFKVFRQCFFIQVELFVIGRSGINVIFYCILFGK